MKVLLTGASKKVGLAAIFSLSKNGISVVGADETQLPFKIHSRNLKSYYTYNESADEKFHQDILSIINKEKPDILVPIRGTQHFSRCKNEIKNYIKLLVPDYESFSSAYNKKKTHKICKETGVAVPKRFSDSEAISLLKSRKNYLVIKPDYDIGGAKGLRYVNTIEDFNSAIEDIKIYSENYVIEEFIPGASRTRTLQLLFDKNNKLISYFILKKIRQWPITGGNTAYAESTQEKHLLDFVMPFFERCPWEGPAGVQLIIDERDKKPKLIEINPRFTGSLSFAIQCGVNFPLYTCMAALDKKNNISSNYNTEKYYLHLSFYLKAVHQEFRFSRNKFSLLKKIFKEIKRKKVGIMIDKKDFPVYLAKILLELKRLILIKEN